MLAATESLLKLQACAMKRTKDVKIFVPTFPMMEAHRPSAGHDNTWTISPQAHGARSRLFQLLVFLLRYVLSVCGDCSEGIS